MCIRDRDTVRKKLNMKLNDASPVEIVLNVMAVMVPARKMQSSNLELVTDINLIIHYAPDVQYVLNNVHVMQ